jgi:tetratricopeptide (TPR) repeat protein
MRTRIEQQLAGGRVLEAREAARNLLESARAAGESAYPAAAYDLAGACFYLGQVLTIAGGSDQAMPLLEEAQARFELVEARSPGSGARMASVCLAERGDCLTQLGRLDEAAAAYEENIRRAEQLGDNRQVAVGEAQLGDVRQRQGRHAEALAAHEEARQRFTQLGEPGSVARSWAKTGSALRNLGQAEAAEAAYHKALAIWVRIRDVAGEASTLGQLGILYHSILGRPEEAAAFHRQAADKYVQLGDAASEGRARNNLGATLQRLRRFDEARREIRRAIECKAQFGHALEPWTSWSILAKIEADAGNPTAAAEAKRAAVACYLAYRRDDGENHYPDGRIALAVTKALLDGDPDAASTFLEQIADNPDTAWLLPLLQALQAIVAGSRDRSLGDAPELDHTMAAEILLLIETLDSLGPATTTEPSH